MTVIIIITGSVLQQATHGNKQVVHLHFYSSENESPVCCHELPAAVHYQLTFLVVVGLVLCKKKVCFVRNHRES